MNTREIAGERKLMRAAGFEDTPSFLGYTRWTHKEQTVLAVRQPWMRDAEWEALLNEKVSQVKQSGTN